MLRIGGSLVILSLLLYFVPLHKLGAAMRKIPPSLWLLLVIGYLGTHLIGVMKWRLTLYLCSAELTLVEAMRCYLAGIFGTVFLPSIVGGDVVRMGLALRLHRNRAGIVLGSLVDRLLDILALAVVAGIGVLLLPGALDPRSRHVFLSVMIGLTAGAAVGFVALAMMPWRRFPMKIRRLLVKLRRAGRSMAERRRYVGVSLLLGVLIQTCLVALSATIASACGLYIPFHVWLLVWPMAKLLALLPLTLGGLGVREAGLAALLAPFGAPAALAVAAGLAWESIIIGGGLIAGLVSFLAGGSLTSLSSLPADRLGASSEEFTLPPTQ